MDNTINLALQFVTKMTKELSDIKYYYNNYGGGTNSSASKIFDSLSNDFGQLGELMLLIQQTINT